MPLSASATAAQFAAALRVNAKLTDVSQELMTYQQRGWSVEMWDKYDRSSDSADKAYLAQYAYILLDPDDTDEDDAAVLQHKVDEVHQRQLFRKQIVAEAKKRRILLDGLGLADLYMCEASGEQVSEEACPVCYSELVAGDVAITYCAHVMCTQCALQWGALNNTCPICRGPVMD